MIQGCDHDTGVWSLYRGVVTIQGCGHDTGVWSLYRGVVGVQGCGRCTGVWSLYRVVVVVQGCLLQDEGGAVDVGEAGGGGKPPQERCPQ